MQRLGAIRIRFEGLHKADWINFHEATTNLWCFSFSASAHQNKKPRLFASAPIRSMVDATSLACTFWLGRPIRRQPSCNQLVSSLTSRPLQKLAGKGERKPQGNY